MIRRAYTKKAWKVKNVVYWIIFTLFLPLWLPFYLLMKIGEISEVVLDFLEWNLLEKTLDKTIPSFMPKSTKRRFVSEMVQKNKTESPTKE